MFDDFTNYSKKKVKLYLKHLAISASKENIMEDTYIPVYSYQPISKKDLPSYTEDHISARRSRDAESETAKADEPREIELRYKSMDQLRKEELEEKINKYYTKKRYMPIILRLKKIKANYLKLRKSKKYSKKKLEELRVKLKACDVILKRIQRLELSPMDLEKF